MKTISIQTLIIAFVLYLTVMLGVYLFFINFFGKIQRQPSLFPGSFTDLIHPSALRVTKSVAPVIAIIEALIIFLISS